MSNQYVSLRNIKFILNEVFNIEELNQYDYYQDYDAEAIKMTLDAAKQLADIELFPFRMEMDKQKPKLKDGVVTAHPQLKKIIKALGDGGWISAHAPYDLGGQQMPLSLQNASLYMFYAANVCAAYAFLTEGAANLILSFGNQELKDYYIPKMFSGEWQGTMALTEPQAGSSLSDITTTAYPQPDGSYKIKGQKIYISGGEHDAVDNIIHLTLARIEGAPAGTKGISLFVVPKYRQGEGEMVFNDVTCAGLFGKMGQKGYVAAQLMFGESDDCRGWLVGEENRGLANMFQLMNEARIATGTMAAGIASASYYASLKYAHERPQGRHLSDKDVTKPQVLIIEHADVKRMLLFQKAISEGSLALLIQCSHYADIVVAAEGEEKENAHLLLELLTPIAKTYPSEMGIQSTNAGIQCLGGAGYCDDFPLEQLARDIRINAIYEGTTGIQGMDLLGRKVMLKGGKALQLLLAEVQATMAAANSETLQPYSEELAKSVQVLGGITQYLIGLAKTERPEVFLTDATLYLEFFGIVVIGWQWLKMGVVAEKALENAKGDDVNFYQGKLAALKFYFAYEIPKLRGLKTRLMNNDRLTLDMNADYIN